MPPNTVYSRYYIYVYAMQANGKHTSRSKNQDASKDAKRVTFKQVTSLVKGDVHILDEGKVPKVHKK